MKHLLCRFLGHKVGKAKVKPGAYFDHEWTIKCSRCGKKENYYSPGGRLYGREIIMGWKP